MDFSQFENNANDRNNSDYVNDLNSNSDSDSDNNTDNNSSNIGNYSTMNMNTNNATDMDSNKRIKLWGIEHLKGLNECLTQYNEGMQPLNHRLTRRLERKCEK